MDHISSDEAAKLQISNAIEKVTSKFPDKLIEPRKAYINKHDGPGFSVFSSRDLPLPGRIKSINAAANNIVILGYRCDVRGLRVTFYGDNHIVFLGGYSNIGASNITVLGSGNIFYFGAFSSAGSMTAQVSGVGKSLAIGDFCMLSSRILATNADGHSIYDSATGLKINHSRDIDVADHVWLGRDVRLNKGAVIGKDSVIGQSSIVSGAIPSATVAAGTPARTIRQGITWSRMECDTLSEMESSERHRLYLKRVESFRTRIVKFSE
jgi:acetyltransferase-like isoleucine patch superfamily enzyme